MKEINRERFEAWLFSQPPEREFRYTDSDGCAFCHFVMETTNLVARCAATWRVAKDRKGLVSAEPQAFPKWMLDPMMLNGVLNADKTYPNGDAMISCGAMQEQYLKLFPEAKEQLVKAKEQTKSLDEPARTNEPTGSQVAPFGLLK